MSYTKLVQQEDGTFAEYECLGLVRWRSSGKQYTLQQLFSVKKSSGEATEEWFDVGEGLR